MQTKEIGEKKKKVEGKESKKCMGHKGKNLTLRLEERNAESSKGRS